MELRKLLLDVFQQCEKFSHLAKNKDEILKRLLNTYHEAEMTPVLRVQTLHVLSYMSGCCLSRDSLDLIHILRESMKSHFKFEQIAAFIAFDNFLKSSESPQLHFEFLLDMILRYEEDESLTVWLIQLLRHMMFGPSILMQVSESD